MTSQILLILLKKNYMGGIIIIICQSFVSNASLALAEESYLLSSVCVQC